jgi:hypothetical protein
MPKSELLAIRRSKISLHRAADNTDPTIRLPYTFSMLAGVSIRVYLTVHDGALTFLAVVSPTPKSGSDKRENAPSSAESVVFTR